MKRRRKRRWPPLGILQGSQRPKRIRTLIWRQKVPPEQSSGEQAYLFTLGTSLAGVEGADWSGEDRGSLSSRESSGQLEATPALCPP